MLKKVKICQLISKKSQHPDRKGGKGVNPYGQPDRKKNFFFTTPLTNGLKIVAKYQIWKSHDLIHLFNLCIKIK